MREKIIEILRHKDGYISGDHVSHSLGVSRQALWKHIEELRGEGYDIEAVPHLGYKLVSAPDKLLPPEIKSGLHTKLIGSEIIYSERTGSTMDTAMKMGIDGAPEGLVVLAESQTKGKGRLGRSWVSPKYKGIYASVLLRPKIMPSQAPVLTLLSAVSVVEAVKEAAGIECQIKWPNDIILHNRKLAGILTELSAELDKVFFIVVGIGINVNNERKTMVSGATSLKDHRKEPVERVFLLKELLRKLESNYLFFQREGSKGILDKWRHYSITLGKRVKVSLNSSILEGEVVDIDSDGALIVRNDCGLNQRVTAGDIIHCR